MLQKNILNNHDGNQIWINVKGELLEYYGEYVLQSWINKLEFIELNCNKIIFSVPTVFIKDWIIKNYLELIKKKWQKYKKDIQFVDIVVLDKKQNNTNDVEILTKNTIRPTIENVYEQSLQSSNLDERFTFENFVVGPPNQLAYEAAALVAEAKEAVGKWNPLFLYGGVGLGKTHLMHSIAWYLKNNNPNRKVIYMSAEKFMYHFVNSLRNKYIISFKEYFRSVDVLIIDDIQFICGKDSTQEEFFHTFNELINNYSQIVISCDRSPSDLDNIENRIRSRLGWGLVVDVHRTTYELRLGILQSKIEQLGTVVPLDILEFLAAKITSNVRELEGALNKVIAHFTLTSEPITLKRTEYLLRDLIRANTKNITVEEIQKKIATRYNIKLHDLVSISKVRKVSWPRQLAMYFSKLLTPKSLVDIAKYFGRKDHTTIMHAIKKVETSCSSNKEIQEEVELLLKIFEDK